MAILKTENQELAAAGRKVKSKIQQERSERFQAHKKIYLPLAIFKDGSGATSQRKSAAPRS